MQPTFLDSSWPQLLGKIGPVSNEFMDSEKSSVFWSIYTTFWQASLISISRAPVLLLELRTALRVICTNPGGEALSRAEPPAGPPKFRKTRFSRKQSKISWFSIIFAKHRIFAKISIFRTHARTRISRGIFLKRIARHATYIPGQLLTSASGENCSRVKRIHGFWEIFIFLIHLHHFWQACWTSISRALVLLLELRPALRVICIFGAKPFPGLRPRQGRQN